MAFSLCGHYAPPQYYEEEKERTIKERKIEQLSTKSSWRDIFETLFYLSFSSSLSLSHRESVCEIISEIFNRFPEVKTKEEVECYAKILFRMIDYESARKKEREKEEMFSLLFRSILSTRLSERLQLALFSILLDRLKERKKNELYYEERKKKMLVGIRRSERKKQTLI